MGWCRYRNGGGGRLVQTGSSCILVSTGYDVSGGEVEDGDGYAGLTVVIDCVDE